MNNVPAQYVYMKLIKMLYIFCCEMEMVRTCDDDDDAQLIIIIIIIISSSSLPFENEVRAYWTDSCKFIYLCKVYNDDAMMTVGQTFRAFVRGGKMGSFVLCLSAPARMKIKPFNGRSCDHFQGISVHHSEGSVQ